MKNFHLPLPEDTYEDLRLEAERSQTPATALAREAISDWLRTRKKAARRKALLDYATAMAGTTFDLDPDLERAGVERLVNERDR